MVAENTQPLQAAGTVRTSLPAAVPQFAGSTKAATAGGVWGQRQLHALAYNNQLLSCLPLKAVATHLCWCGLHPASDIASASDDGRGPCCLPVTCSPTATQPHHAETAAGCRLCAMAGCLVVGDPCHSRLCRCVDHGLRWQRNVTISHVIHINDSVVGHIVKQHAATNQLQDLSHCCSSALGERGASHAVING